MDHQISSLSVNSHHGPILLCFQDQTIGFSSLLGVRKHTEIKQFSHPTLYLFQKKAS